MKGMILFFLNVFLYMAGGIVEKFNSTLGLIVLLLALAMTVFIVIAERRGRL